MTDSQNSEPRTTDGLRFCPDCRALHQLRDCPLPELHLFLEQQEALGQEFEAVLYDNLWSLYAHD